VLVAIARNEFKSLFRTPLGWILLALSQFILATIYYNSVNLYLNKQYLGFPVSGVGNEIASFLVASNIFIVMIIAPVLAMLAITNERHQNTLSLLLAAPIGEAQLLFGKLAGLTLYLSILLAEAFIISLSLSFGSSLDYGILFSSMFGMFLVIVTFLSISLYIASMTSQAAIAIAGAMGVLLLMLLVESMAFTRYAWLDQSLVWISSFSHLENFRRGIIDSRDIFYFIIISCTALSLTLLRFRKLRQSL